MTNKEIAKTFQLLGDIMELHGENPFKIKSYQSAYIQLRKLDTPLADMTADERAQVKGVGKTIAEKIQELLETGTLQTLDQYRAKTPDGVVDMLGISGFGPKKIQTIWKELGITSLGELQYAVNENRLLEAKGFGKKTQEDLKEKLAYLLRSKGYFHYATLEAEANQLLPAARNLFPQARIEWTGDFRRACTTLSCLELLCDDSVDPQKMAQALQWTTAPNPGLLPTPGHPSADTQTYLTATGTPIAVYTCPADSFGSKLFRYSAGDRFMKAFLEKNTGLDFKGLAEEITVFDKANIPFIPPFLRDLPEVLDWPEMPTVVQESDIKGVVHLHTTYSDGLHTLEEMAVFIRSKGFGYMGVSDHSQAAFYANGLKEDRVKAQWEEIDQLNQKLAPFRLFKSIECDILADGRLDYSDELLAGFDFVIASVHTNLNMDEEKATRRLLRAIENPHTRILGHPTGRLLLSRPGYPIDHKTIIDACAQHQVAIELNANPWRLDLDYTWIPYAVSKGVRISINPDAHSREGVGDIRYGVLAAQKGGLQSRDCLTCLSTSDFEAFCTRKT